MFTEVASALESTTASEDGHPIRAIYSLALADCAQLKRTTASGSHCLNDAGNGSVDDFRENTIPFTGQQAAARRHGTTEAAL
jgi:hypothetical protein